MNFKDIGAAPTTQTYNRNKIEEATGNIYESIVIMGKRAEQVNQEMKSELIQKLDEFAAHTDSLEEVFEIESKLRFLNSTKDFQSQLQLQLKNG